MTNRVLCIESPKHGDGAPARLRSGAADDLRCFVTAMALQGWPTAVARMVYDPIYARERIALAHTSADETLRALAVRLFCCYAPGCAAMA